jgi:ureidoglycolate hydrolase
MANPSALTMPSSSWIRALPGSTSCSLRVGGRNFAPLPDTVSVPSAWGALEGKDWLLGVAPPGEADKPDPEEIQAFYIPGNCFIKLDIGTWHAGPYFTHDIVSFYNLELSNTNEVDHQTCNLAKDFGMEFEIR